MSAIIEEAPMAHVRPNAEQSQYDVKIEECLLDLERRVETRLREVDAQLSRGNVLLQCGMVAYKDEVDDLRERFIRMKF
jgi:hypothetical protein